MDWYDADKKKGSRMLVQRYFEKLLPPEIHGYVRVAQEDDVFILNQRNVLLGEDVIYVCCDSNGNIRAVSANWGDLISVAQKHGVTVHAIN